LQKPDKIILGIDPGTLMMGYGIISIFGKKVEINAFGVLKLSGKDNHYLRLKQIHHKVTELISGYQPDSFAIEAPFFGKNVQSMLKLGRAQGVAIAAAMQQGLEIFEYSPRRIKQVITGNGNAGKEQVWKMMQEIFQRELEATSFDGTDALAVALCHYYDNNSLPVKKSTGKKNLSSWEKFIAMNPHRVK
jgi:crossover junction endodeoxyribonuclease RuvC